MIKHACQLLNNLLETQDSQPEGEKKPPLLRDVLSDEEGVLGRMCDSFRSAVGTGEKKSFFPFPAIRDE